MWNPRGMTTWKPHGIFRWNFLTLLHVVKHGWRHAHEVLERSWVFIAELHHQPIIQALLWSSRNPVSHPDVSGLSSPPSPPSPGQHLMNLEPGICSSWSFWFWNRSSMTSLLWGFMLDSEKLDVEEELEMWSTGEMCTPRQQDLGWREMIKIAAFIWRQSYVS